MRVQLLAAAAALVCTLAIANETPRWLRQNAISPDGNTVAFVYQGDIWLVPATGRIPAGLPEPLRDTALLRLANPEASLSDLALLSNPPVTKSCLSHRLNKIISLAGEEES